MKHKRAQRRAGRTREEGRRFDGTRYAELNKILGGRFLFLLFAALSGAIVGVLCWLYMKVANVGITLIWEKIPNALDFKYYTIVMCLIGGLVVGLFHQIYGPYPENLHEAMGRLKEEGRYSYKHMPLTMIAALLSIFFGGAVGPENGLICLILGMVFWVIDQFDRGKVIILAYVQQDVLYPRRKIVKKLIRSWFYSADRLESGSGQVKWYTREVVPAGIAAGVCGLLAYGLLSVFIGEVFTLPRLESGPLYIKDWFGAILLIAVGVFAGRFYMFCKKITSVFFGWLHAKNQHIISAVLGGLILGLIGSAIPMTMFSGGSDIQTLMYDYLQYTPYRLILYGVIKLFLTNVCIESGWRGGYFFPVVFAGLSIGYGFSLILGLNQIFSVVVVTATLLGTILQQPIGALALSILFFPVAQLGWMIVGSFAGGLIPLPETIRNDPEDKGFLHKIMHRNDAKRNIPKLPLKYNGVSAQPQPQMQQGPVSSYYEETGGWDDLGEDVTADWRAGSASETNRKKSTGRTAGEKKTGRFGKKEKTAREKTRKKPAFANAIQWMNIVTSENGEDARGPEYMWPKYEGTFRQAWQVFFVPRKKSHKKKKKNASPAFSYEEAGGESFEEAYAGSPEESMNESFEDSFTEPFEESFESFEEPWEESFEEPDFGDSSTEKSAGRAAGKRGRTLRKEKKTRDRRLKKTRGRRKESAEYAGQEREDSSREPEETAEGMPRSETAEETPGAFVGNEDRIGNETPGVAGEEPDESARSAERETKGLSDTAEEEMEEFTGREAFASGAVAGNRSEGPCQAAPEKKGRSSRAKKRRDAKKEKSRFLRRRLRRQPQDIGGASYGTEAWDVPAGVSYGTDQGEVSVEASFGTEEDVFSDELYGTDIEGRCAPKGSGCELGEEASGNSLDPETSEENRVELVVSETADEMSGESITAETGEGEPNESAAEEEALAQPIEAETVERESYGSTVAEIGEAALDETSSESCDESFRKPQAEPVAPEMEDDFHEPPAESAEKPEEQPFVKAEAEVHAEGLAAEHTGEYTPELAAEHEGEYAEGLAAEHEGEHAEGLAADSAGEQAHQLAAKSEEDCAKKFTEDTEEMHSTEQNLRKGNTVPGEKAAKKSKKRFFSRKGTAGRGSR